MYTVMTQSVTPCFTLVLLEKRHPLITDLNMVRIRLGYYPGRPEVATGLPLPGTYPDIVWLKKW